MNRPCTPANPALAGRPHFRYGVAMHVALRRLLIATPLALVCSGAPACTTTSSSADEVSVTLVSVRPSDFAGQVPCGNAQGAWKTWVATLIDVTHTGEPFTLASSIPASCSMPIAFSYVIPEHRYVAEIDAYDRDDLVPYGGASSGSRHMVDPATGAEVAPRWTAQCPSTDSSAGSEDPDAGVDVLGGPAVATLYRNVFVLGCSTLQESLPPQDGSIVVNVSSVLSGQSCGSEPGQIDHLVVAPSDPALAEQQASCDSTLSFQPVVNDRTYAFRVSAFEPGSASPAWGTTCQAVARSGLAVTATCDTLTSSGSLRVDVDSLVSLSGHSCAADDVVSYRAVLVGEGSAVTHPCTSDAVFGPLPAGAWQVVVDGLSSAGDTVFTAFCEAAVTPAAQTTAVCSLR